MREMTTLEDQFRALWEDLAANPARPDQDRRISLLVAAYREDRDALVNSLYAGVVVAGIEAAAERRGFERGRLAAAPRPRGARHASSSPRSIGLRLVQGLAPVGGLGAALKGSWTGLRQSPAHAWVASHVAHVVAGGATLTVGAVVATAAVTLAPSPAGHPSSATAPGSSASAPGWGTSATPITSPRSALIASVTHPRPRLEAKGARNTPPFSLAAPPSYYVPASSPPSQQSAAPSASASVAAGPATLSVSSSAVDLTSLTQGTVTLSASGSGWVSWRVSTTGTDLDFSAVHGVLQAGQSYQLVVSLDAAQDGLQVQVFSVNGAQVAVDLPLPLPAVVPSSAPSLPADLPSGLPS